MAQANRQITVRGVLLHQFESKIWQLIIAFLVVGVLYPATAYNAPVAAGVNGSNTKIEDLAWIEGDWYARGSESAGTGMGQLDADDELQERWSAPMGDSMIGAFRWHKGGKVWMFEFLTIVEEGDELLLRWKHFNRELVGWEEKDVSLSYRLVSLEQRKAVFENISKKDKRGPWRVTYHRTNESSMSIRLEGFDKQTPPSVFRFRLRNPVKMEKDD